MPNSLFLNINSLPPQEKSLTLYRYRKNIPIREVILPLVR